MDVEKTRCVCFPCLLSVCVLNEKKQMNGSEKTKLQKSLKSEVAQFVSFVIEFIVFYSRKGFNQFLIQSPDSWALLGKRSV